MGKKKEANKTLILWLGEEKPTYTAVAVRTLHNFIIFLKFSNDSVDFIFSGS